jgi:hypothetical protein
MKIRLGKKYWLNSDQFCYWITQDVKIKEGKRAGSIDERRCSGYTATFEQCVDSFIDKQIKQAEITQYSELVKEIEKLKKEVRSWKCQVERKK